MPESVVQPIEDVAKKPEDVRRHDLENDERRGAGTIITSDRLPAKLLETRDSISSIDSDVSLSFDRHNASHHGSDDDSVINHDHINEDDDDNEEGAPLPNRHSNGNDAIGDKVIIDRLAIGNETVNRQTNGDVSVNNRGNVETELKDRFVNGETIGKREPYEETMADVALSSSSSDTDDAGAKDSGCEVAHETNYAHDDDDEETGPPFVKPDDSLIDRIVQQVEFYFSDANLMRDAFLLKHVRRNKEGYVSLKLISSFKRVKHVTKDWRVVAYALSHRSTRLAVNESGTKLRRIEPLPKHDETTPSRTIVACNLKADADGQLTIERVAERFRDCGEIALVRLLRAGNPVPQDVRQFLNKNPLLLSDGRQCAIVEFARSESARRAIERYKEEAVERGEDAVQVYELNGVPQPERKKKPKKTNNGSSNSGGSSSAQGGLTQNGAAQNGAAKCGNSKPNGKTSRGTNCAQPPPAACFGHYAHHQPQQGCHSNNFNKACHQLYHHDNNNNTNQQQQNNADGFLAGSSCCCCSCAKESLDAVTPPARRYLRRGFSAQFPSKTLEPAAWLQRRLSASSTEASFMFVPRRLSYDRTTAASGNATNNPHHNDYGCAPNGCHHYHQQYPYHHNHNQFYGGNGLGSRRASTASSSYASGGSTQSLYEAYGTRSRSNSGAFLMNGSGGGNNGENVVRLPKGPDGSKGFRQRALIVNGGSTNNGGNDDNNNCNDAITETTTCDERADE